MDRSERLIKPGNSWYSPKCIEVQPRVKNGGGRALDGLGPYPVTNPNQTANAAISDSGVSLREISSGDERERARIAS